MIQTLERSRPCRVAGPGARARGFTLIEALVALLTLSIGLLGIAGLQLAGLKNNLSASWRSQGTYLAYDILDRMRANRDNSTAYATLLGAAPGGSTTAAMDLQSWKSHLASTLPGGDGTVTVDAADKTLITITVQWDDSRGVDPPLVFQMRSRI